MGEYRYLLIFVVIISYYVWIIIWREVTGVLGEKKIFDFEVFRI